MTHELKCWPEFFSAIQNWKKLFEIRHNDRSFEVGDILWLREWVSSSREYTGASVKRRISYMTDFQSGLRDGYVCMSLETASVEKRVPEFKHSRQKSKSVARYLAGHISCGSTDDRLCILRIATPTPYRMTINARKHPAPTWWIPPEPERRRIITALLRLSIGQRGFEAMWLKGTLLTVRIKHWHGPERLSWAAAVELADGRAVNARKPPGKTLRPSRVQSKAKGR